MSDTVLQTENLTKYFGKNVALDHLNLKIERGCIYGLLGRNGAGKTTAIKLLLGLLTPTAGSSHVLGCNSRDLTPDIRQRIGYVSEGHRLYRWMRIGQLARFQRAFFPGQWDDGLFAQMMDYFGLTTKQKVKELSNGQRAQVSLALAMAPGPELLIMDDPTLGLDTAIRRQFLQGMIQLIQSNGRTIIFSSHILSDVERVADRVAIIHDGVLRADCSLDEFRRSIRKIRAKLGDSGDVPADIPGLLHVRQGQGELELTLAGTTDSQIERWADQAGIAAYRVVEMNMEDQFIEFTEKENSGRLFEWEKV